MNIKYICRLISSKFNNYVNYDDYFRELKIKNINFIFLIFMKRKTILKHNLKHILQLSFLFLSFQSGL